MAQLKKDNLHVFVEDARHTLQRLWDELYFSEDEMLEFTAAFTGKIYIVPRPRAPSWDLLSGFKLIYSRRRIYRSPFSCA